MFISVCLEVLCRRQWWIICVTCSRVRIAVLRRGTVRAAIIADIAICVAPTAALVVIAVISGTIPLPSPEVLSSSYAASAVVQSSPASAIDDTPKAFFAGFDPPAPVVDTPILIKTASTMITDYQASEPPAPRQLASYRHRRHRRFASVWPAYCGSITRPCNVQHIAVPMQ